MFLSDGGHSGCLFLREVHSGVNSEECFLSTCKIKCFLKRNYGTLYIQLYEGSEN